MNTQYANLLELDDSPHVQIEARTKLTGDTGGIDQLGGGREWITEKRVHVDGEPVTDWLGMDQHDDADLAESADHPAVTEQRLSKIYSVAWTAFKQDRWDKDFEPASDSHLAYYTDAPPWTTSKGYGGFEKAHYLLG